MHDRRLIIAVVLVVLAVIQIETVMAGADKWSRYTIGGGALSCEFPSEPEVDTKTLPGIPGKIYLCTSRDEEMNFYGAMFMDDVGVNLEKFSPKELDYFYKSTAAGLKKGMLEKLGKLEATFEVTEAGEKEVIFAGLAGRERDYAVGPVKGIVRMAISGHALFMGFAAVPPDIPEKVLERFFGSFQLSKTPAKAAAMHYPRN